MIKTEPDDEETEEELPEKELPEEVEEELDVEEDKSLDEEAEDPSGKEGLLDETRNINEKMKTEKIKPDKKKMIKNNIQVNSSETFRLSFVEE